MPINNRLKLAGLFSIVLITRLLKLPKNGWDEHLADKLDQDKFDNLDISTPKLVLSWANHALGGQETQMAKNVASLPFVFKHVALMPDVHLGKGALVGSVVATTDAIMTKYCKFFLKRVDVGGSIV